MRFTIRELEAILANGTEVYGWDKDSIVFDISNTNGLPDVPEQFKDMLLQQLADEIWVK